MKSLAAALALFASVLLTDVHWAVMQSISWVEMSWNASPSSERSIADLLSGKTVCHHCDAIREGQESDGERTCDLLAQGRILAPVAWEQLRLPDRSWTRVRWLERASGLPGLFVPGVQKPPPRIS